MFQKIFNNTFINRILVFFKLDKHLQRANNYWEKYETNLNKTHQEIAGYSHSKDVQETVDKTHSTLKLFFDKYTSDKAVILDIGCGPGLYLSDFPKSTQLFGIDLSEKMLSLAKTNCPHATLINDEFLKYVFTVKFDLIYSIGVLQYIPKSELDSFFKKIHELLNTNGIFFISYPHAISSKDLTIPDINYINYSPEYLNSVVSKYFNLIQNKHILDDREITDFDKSPYKPLNVNFDKTYKNSSILVGQKK